jgi:prephenate dehydratase
MSATAAQDMPIAGLVAFQGERGAYSEEAVRALWPEARPVPMRTNLDVARAVSTGAVDAGVLPVENTLAGSVVDTWDAIVSTEPLHAVAETVVPIHHCVLALPGATVAQLRTVESHPVALAQCHGWFARHPHVRATAAADTAGAAAAIASAGDPTRAALAGRHAAALHALEILAVDVEDRLDNQTRFLALARARRTLPLGTRARSALIVGAPNEPGALLRLLAPIAAHGLNVSRIESRPTGVPWTYRFFLDIEHEVGCQRFAAAVAALHHLAAVRVVGTVAAHGVDAT